MKSAGYMTSWMNSQTSDFKPSKLLVSVLLGASSRMTGLRTSRYSKTSCRDWTLNPVATLGFWRSRSSSKRIASKT
jgi:hypothetical protein